MLLSVDLKRSHHKKEMIIKGHDTGWTNAVVVIIMQYM